MPLFPTEHWREMGNLLRALLNRAILASSSPPVTYELLAEQTGIDPKQIGRALKDDGGAHPPLALVACVMAHDRSGIVITGLADLVGYDATPKKPDLVAENRRLREQLAEIRALLNATSEP